MHQICVRSLVALRRIVYKIYQQYPCLAGQRSLPLGLIVNADSMLVRNPASLGIENQRTKCVKMFRSNCIDFGPTTTMYYAYSTIKVPDKGEVGGSSPPRPTIQIPKKYAARELKYTLGQGAAPRGILGASQLQESRLV